MGPESTDSEDAHVQTGRRKTKKNNTIKNSKSSNGRQRSQWDSLPVTVDRVRETQAEQQLWMAGETKELEIQFKVRRVSASEREREK